MRVLVELNSSVDAFSIGDVHKNRLIAEFPHHEFVFMDTYNSFKKNIEGAEAALVWKFPTHLYEKAVKLKYLYTPAAGKDWVANDPKEHVQTYFSQFHGQLISESFLSMLLFNNTNTSILMDNSQRRSWAKNAVGKRSLLRNQSLLIVGCGSIGDVCAEKALSLGMRVTGVKRILPGKGDFPYAELSDLKGIVSEYDHILNLLPGGALTERFIDAALIGCFKQNASFYNFGRGTTVDEGALIASLQKSKIKFAGLDVSYEEPLSQESELWGMKNVFITPHNSCCYSDYLHLFIDELKEKL
jgi:D-2-hydroxyacid dehydrogenase (NADP+)